MPSPRARATALASLLLAVVLAGFCTPFARAAELPAVSTDPVPPPLWEDPAATTLHGRMSADRAFVPFVAQSLPEDAAWEGLLTPANLGTSGTFVEYQGKLVLTSSGVAGSVLTQGLVMWGGTKFEALPAITGYVTALGVWNDHLIAATQNYPPSQNAILQLDGAVWDTLGHADNYVEKFSEFQGHLIASGRFTAVNGVPSPLVAAFDGSSWSKAGTGIAGYEVTGLTVHLGKLVAGGNITPAQGVVSLDTLGGAWQAVGTGFRSGVKDVLSDGVELYASGTIVNSIGTAVVGTFMRWNGTAWIGTGSPTISGMPDIYMTRWNGKVVVGVPVTVPGSVGKLAQWDGVALTPIPGDSLNGTPWRIGTWGTKLVGTGPTFNGSVKMPQIFTYDGSQWGTVQEAWGPEMSGTLRPPSDMRSWGGKLIVSGFFFLEADQDHWVAGHDIAAWDGTHWSTLGNGIYAGGGYIVLGEYAGNLIAAGDNMSVIGLPNSDVASWNGVSWSALGTGAPDYVESIAEFQNQLYLGTDEGLWHQNNSTWSSVPALDGQYVFAVAPSGPRLIVGGSFTQGGAIGSPNVVFWDGANLQPAGAGVNSNVYAATEWLGQPVIGGPFTASGATPLPGVAIWDGSQWQPMGTRAVEVYQLRVRDGELFASGEFRLPDDSVVETIAHWTGTDWHVLGSGSNEYSFAIYGGYLYQPGYGLVRGHPSHGLARVPLAAVLDVPRPQPITAHVALAMWPNPVRGRAHFAITLPAAAHARLTVHDVAGRLLATLNDGELAAGEHQFEWAAAAEPAVYFIRLVTPSLRENRRFVVLKP